MVEDTVFVTDNARNVDKMRRELEEEDENLIPYGCLSHVLNLLGQDLTPAPIMKHIVESNKFFRKHHVPSAWLNVNQDPLVLSYQVKLAGRAS